MKQITQLYKVRVFLFGEKIKRLDTSFKLFFNQSIVK